MQLLFATGRPAAAGASGSSRCPPRTKRRLRHLRWMEAALAVGPSRCEKHARTTADAGDRVAVVHREGIGHHVVVNPEAATDLIGPAGEAVTETEEAAIADTPQAALLVGRMANVERHPSTRTIAGLVGTATVEGGAAHRPLRSLSDVRGDGRRGAVRLSSRTTDATVEVVVATVMAGTVMAAAVVAAATVAVAMVAAVAALPVDPVDPVDPVAKKTGEPIESGVDRSARKRRRRATGATKKTTGSSLCRARKHVHHRWVWRTAGPNERLGVLWQ